MGENYTAGTLDLEILGYSNKAVGSITETVKALNSLSRSLNRVYKSSELTKKSGKNIKNLFSVGSLGITNKVFNIYMVRKMAKSVADIVQAGSDYLETLNLWQVAMRDNLELADQFVTKLNKAYGISTKAAMEAQATFKNMIGSLGQISDEAAYKLSESLVLMSADYASLYNRTLESALSNMQSMLAGQVRPIRSAGLDVTETTLYQFYQALGGTKTMRQLNRTEKQLLSILAVYQQMGKAGATGDMAKTLNQFANQSRMMAEYWQELKTWTGLVLKDLIDQSGALIHINAMLITASEIMKAIAKSRGLGEDNFLTGLFETAEATNDAVDELQGKLLDFDKFRALDEGGGDNALGIDEKLLEALSGYTSVLDQAENEARKLAENWLKALGATEDANGKLVFTEDALDKIIGKITTIVGAISSVPALLLGAKLAGSKVFGSIIALIAYGYTTNEEFRESVNRIVSALLDSLLPALDAVTRAIAPVLDAITPIIELIAKIIVFIDDLVGLENVLYAVGGAIIFIKGVDLYQNLMKSVSGMQSLEKSAKSTTSALNMITTAVMAFAASYNIVSGFINMFSGDTRTFVASASVLVGAIMAIVAAWLAFRHVVTWGTATPLMLAGIGAAIAGAKALTPTVETFANGGTPDKGTMFIAGEAGAEIVATSPNGQTGVSNVKQIEQAMYNALVAYGKTSGGQGGAIEVYLDGEKVYQNTTAHAKRRGNVWSKV